MGVGCTLGGAGEASFMESPQDSISQEGLGAVLRQSYEELSMLGPGVSLRLNIQALNSYRCQAGWTAQSDTSEKGHPLPV